MRQGRTYSIVYSLFYWALEEDQVTVVQASAEHHLLLYREGEVHIEGKIFSNLLIN